MNCAIPECGGTAMARGWCIRHYKRWIRNGDPLTLKVDSTPAGVLKRFLSKVRKTESCWLWTGYFLKGGYGQIRVQGRNLLVHRFSYEVHRGPIPEGMEIDHICSTPACVNPAHLESVTPRENVRRVVQRGRNVNAAKIECVNGHPFTPSNTQIRKNGNRACIACRNASERKQYHARKQERQDV